MRHALHNYFNYSYVSFQELRYSLPSTPCGILMVLFHMLVTFWDAVRLYINRLIWLFKNENIIFTGIKLILTATFAYSQRIFVWKVMYQLILSYRKIIKEIQNSTTDVVHQYFFPRRPLQSSWQLSGKWYLNCNKLKFRPT